MDTGGGVQQSHSPVPAGQYESHLSKLSNSLILKAGLVLAENIFPEFPDDEPIGPLKMDHIYFPLMLWIGGLVLSAVAFLAEIIFKRIGNQQ